MVLGLAMVAGCFGGGANITATGDPAVTIAVSGTVSGIAASADVSTTKGVRTVYKDAADITGAGLTVTCSTLDGVRLGTVISATDGTFTLNTDVDALKPITATDTSYDVDIICAAESGDGKVDFKTIYTFNVVEGTTTDVSVGAIDVDSTLAAASLGGDLGCDLKVGSKCTKLSGMDLQCARSGLGATWSQTSTTNTGDVAYLTGELKAYVRSLYTAGANWADLECKTSTTCIKKFTDCTLSDADLAIVFQLLETVTPETIDSNFATNKAHWTAACTATEAIHDIVTTSLAGSSDAAATCTALAAGGDAFARTLTQPFLAVAAADVAKLSNLFPPKALNFVGNVIKNSSSVDLSGGGHTLLSYLANQLDTHNNFEHLPTQTSEFAFLGSVVKQSVGMSSDQQASYATGWFHSVEANGFNAFCPTGTCGDTTTAGFIGVVGSAFVQPGFNPSSHNYTEDRTIFTQAPTLGNDEKANVLACHSLANMTAKINCFHGMNGVITTTGTTASTPLAAPTEPVTVTPDPVVATPDSYFDGTWATNGCLGGAVTIATGTGGGMTFTSHSSGTCTVQDASNQSVSCTYIAGASSPTSITLSNTCTLTVPPPPLNSYWNGTWYSSNPSCIPNLSVATLLASTTGGSPTAVGRFIAPSNQAGAGTCTIYNNGTPNVAATGCGYAGAGSGTLSAASSVISVTGFTGQNGTCSANLTKTPHTYFDGTWYADNVACYAFTDYALTNGSSANGLTISTHNNGACTATMTGQDVNCTYVANTSITFIKPASGQTPSCTTILTIAPPTPGTSYFDGFWTHINDPFYDCPTQSGSIVGMTWVSESGLTIQFFSPGHFAANGSSGFSVTAGGLGGGGDLYNYLRPFPTPIQSVEGGTSIVINGVNTFSNGMCKLRLTKLF